VVERVVLLAGLHLVGLVLLSIGAALYAAGMSSGDSCSTASASSSSAYRQSGKAKHEARDASLRAFELTTPKLSKHSS
jgi:hypothetical protein